MSAAPTAADGLPRAGARVVLRRLAASDLAAFQRYRTREDVGRYQGWTKQTDADAVLFLESMRVAPFPPRDAWVQLAIADPTDDRLIGDLGVHVSADGHEGELGFTLDPASQGRGLAADALTAALALLFDTTTIDRVVCVTDARNLPSIRLLERVGFRHEDTVDAVFRGEPCREHRYVVQRRADDPAAS